MIGNPLNVSQFANFSAAVLKALPRNMTAENAKRWEDNGEKLAAALASALSPLATPAPRKKQPKPKLKYQSAADGTITFSVTSDGTTGPQWMARLKAARHKVAVYAKQLLLSHEFVPMVSMTAKIVVLPGSLWTDSDRLTSNIRVTATDRRLVKPNVEVACLIRMMFTNEEINAMGLRYLVVMHKPLKDAGGGSLLFTVVSDGTISWLNAHWDSPDYQWNQCDGFVFVLPQD